MLLLPEKAAVAYAGSSMHKMHSKLNGAWKLPGRAKCMHSYAKQVTVINRAYCIT